MLPREVYESEVYKKNRKTLTIRGGGAYYSFARLTHEYGYGSDLSLDSGYLSVGFAGADYGMMIDLGDVSLDEIDRVTLDAEGRIVLSYTPNNEEGHKRLIAKLKELMQQQIKCGVHGHDCHEGLFARNLFVGQRIPLAGVAHQVGTVRFGNDPKSSALDAKCKAHDLDNLYVVDGSFFVSSGAVNPGLTIMANALRVGQHLTARMK